MSQVFLVDTHRQPLDPVHPGQARLLLTQGKAAVWRRFPFTLILKTASVTAVVRPLRLKIDPGSKVTGIALVNDATGAVALAAELLHRGAAITKALDQRRAVRRSRRSRHTRYRAPRFQNRRRQPGWLPPSLESRLANILTWVQRLRRCAPITAISVESVTFDTQAMQNPEIHGVLYQQGELMGFEVREYLLEKWQRRCAYCGKQNVPLQVEHIVARACGGTDRVSNLTLACQACNAAKGRQPIDVFLANKPEVLTRILAQAKVPLKDAAAVNASRRALCQRLLAMHVPIETGSGALTKYNRTSRSLPKTHWLDACCVGASTPAVLLLDQVQPLVITANGHGSRQMCLVDARGFPRSRPKDAKKVKGFQTGDMVRAIVSSGKHAGRYIGRVAIRATGSFNITARHKTVQGISHRFCTTLHQCDGYNYTVGKERALPPQA